ncbi:MAG: ribose-phosphate pyrophosphokinase-like domain-containing protein, partial [Oscillospiraceae bacterium]
MSNIMNTAPSIPVGNLGIIGMVGCQELADKVDNYLVQWRNERAAITNDNHNFLDYIKDTYQIQAECPRFGTGESKGLIKETVRGSDLYILCDVFNHGITYKMYGKEVPMSPDDHYADLKRIIA